MKNANTMRITIQGLGYTIKTGTFALLVVLVPYYCSAGPNAPAPVIVSNTSANPVPVVQQGPVSIAGGVTISGTPNVTVGNTAAFPLPVQDVDRPTAEPVVGTFVNASPFNFINMYTVPVGKRLIVEHVSALLNVPTGVKVIDGQLNDLLGAGPIGKLYLLPTFTGASSSTTDRYVISQPIKFYVAGGDTLQAVFDSFPSTQSLDAFCSFSGYLVDAP